LREIAHDIWPARGQALQIPIFGRQLNILKPGMNKLTRITIMIIVTAMLGTGCSKDNTPAGEEPKLTVTDIDGNVYQTVRIGSQTWMAENLKVTALNDGTPLELFTFAPDNDRWFFSSTTIPMYTWPFTGDLNNLHNEELPLDFYGAIYSHAAIESGRLAPAGWRIPSGADYLELMAYLANNGFGGAESSALCSAEGWAVENGTNTSGFNGLPNGYCTISGSATGAQAIASLCTSDVDGAGRKLLNLIPQENFTGFTENDIRFGAGIRCIKE
jgi:uncharacterized protein (TIGR02145 family)